MNPPPPRTAASLTPPPVGRQAPDDPRPRARPSWGWARWAWRTLTSMRTAVILLALLALAAIPGSVLPQRNVASDPAAVQRYQAEHPDLAPWLDRLGLFDVYASPWFAAVYLLLLVSMTGCVLPRSRRLWHSARSAPPVAPRNLARLEQHDTWVTERPADDVLATAAAALRRRRFRVVVDGDQVRAEKGYLREVGNLVFHLSLLVLLVGVGVDRLFGFEGRVVVTEGSTFAHAAVEYDAFTPSVWTDEENLEPFSLRLADLHVAYATEAAKLGEPREFRAEVSYRTEPGASEQQTEIEPNHPLNVDGTKVFLTGNGYAPRVTVRDGRGDVVFSGPAVFFPRDLASYASDGTIKAPGGRPTELAFEGFFLPTADIGPQGPYSRFPDTLNPQLFLTAYTGDLGLDDGVPESVYDFDKSQMTQVRQDGKPFARALTVGETMRLPGGNGSLTFDGVSRFANFQITNEPGKEITLGAALLLLFGLTASLSISRRRLWVRVRPSQPRTGNPTTTVEVASRSLSRRAVPAQDLETVRSTLKPAEPPTPASDVDEDTP